MVELTAYLGSDADGALFDASQYAFFGQDIAEEVELGGLEDDQDNSDLAVGGGLGDGEIHEYHLFEKDEVQSAFTSLVLCMKYLPLRLGI